MDIKIGTRVVYDGRFWTINNTLATIKDDRIQFSFQLKSIGTATQYNTPAFKWLDADSVTVISTEDDIVHITSKGKEN